MMHVLINTGLILCALLALSSCKVEKFHLVKVDDLQRTEYLQPKLTKEKSPYAVVVVNIDDRDTLSNTLFLYKSDVKDGIISGEPSATDVNPNAEYYHESMRKMNNPLNLNRMMDIRKEDKHLPLNRMYVFVADSTFQHVKSHSELNTKNIQNAERIWVGQNGILLFLALSPLWILLLLSITLVIAVSTSSFWG